MAIGPDLKSQLVSAAVEILAEQGRQGLTARGVAQLAGTSTMAVYTCFGGMAELRSAVRQHGFSELAGALTAGRSAEDPLFAVAAMAAQYLDFAAARPTLYRAMWAEAPAAQAARDALISPLEPIFETLRRWMSAESVDAEIGDLAIHLWSVLNGIVTLALGNYVTAAEAENRLFGIIKQVLRANTDLDRNRWLAAIDWARSRNG